MYNDNDIRFANFMNSYKDILSSKYHEFENIRLNFLKNKRLFLLLLFVAAVLSVFLNILGLKFHIASKAYSYLVAIEAVILILIFTKYSVVIENKYRKELKKSFLLPLLKDLFNIEKGAEIPIEYLKNIKYINSGNRRIEKKIRDDSFHGKHNGIEFQVEEANIYNNNDSKTTEKYLLLHFKLNKPSNVKIAINTKESSLYKHPATVFSFIFVFVIFAILILWSNWELIIEDNLFLTNLTTTFAKWFLNWFSKCYLIWEIGAPIFLFLFLFIFNAPFKYFEKIKLKKAQFETNGKQIKPEFLNLLEELSYVYGAYRVSCRLVNSSFTIAVGTKLNIFETGNIRTPMIQSKAIYNFYKEINIIFKIIDYLVENNEDITA